MAVRKIRRKTRGDKNVTAEVKKKPAVPLPSLNPLVEEVLPAVVSISARLSGEAAAQADKSADEGEQRALSTNC
jgi:hypothetical protein